MKRRSLDSGNKNQKEQNRKDKSALNEVSFSWRAGGVLFMQNVWWVLTGCNLRHFRTVLVFSSPFSWTRSLVPHFWIFWVRWGDGKKVAEEYLFLLGLIMGRDKHENVSQNNMFFWKTWTEAAALKPACFWCFLASQITVFSRRTNKMCSYGKYQYCLLIKVQTGSKKV